MPAKANLQNRSAPIGATRTGRRNRSEVLHVHANDQAPAAWIFRTVARRDEEIHEVITKKCSLSIGRAMPAIVRLCSCVPCNMKRSGPRARKMKDYSARVGTFKRSSTENEGLFFVGRMKVLLQPQLVNICSLRYGYFSSRGYFNYELFLATWIARLQISALTSHSSLHDECSRSRRRSDCELFLAIRRAWLQVSRFTRSCSPRNGCSWSWRCFG